MHRKMQSTLMENLIPGLMLTFLPVWLMERIEDEYSQGGGKFSENDGLPE